MSHGSVDPVEVRSKVRKKIIKKSHQPKKNKNLLSDRPAEQINTVASLATPATIPSPYKPIPLRLDPTGALTVHIPFARLPLNNDDIPAFCYDDAVPEPKDTTVKDFLLNDFSDNTKNHLINLQFHFNLQNQINYSLPRGLLLKLQKKLLPLFHDQQTLVSLFDALPELMTQMVIKKWYRILLKNFKFHATTQYHIILECFNKNQINIHLKSSRTETIATVAFKSDENINAHDKFILHLINCGADLKNKENTFLITTQGHTCRTQFVLHDTVQMAANSLWQKNSMITTCSINEGNELLQNAKVNPILDLQLEFVKHKYKKIINDYIADRSTHTSAISKAKIIKAKKLLTCIEQAQTIAQLKLMIDPNQLQKTLISHKRTVLWGLFKVGRAMLYDKLCAIFQETELQLELPYADLAFAKTEFVKAMQIYIDACQKRPSKLKIQNIDKAKMLLTSIEQARNSAQLKWLISPANLQQTLTSHQDSLLGRLFNYGKDPLYLQLCKHLKSLNQQLSARLPTKNYLDNNALLEAKKQYEDKCKYYDATLAIQEKALDQLKNIQDESQHQYDSLSQRYQVILDTLKTKNSENIVSDSLNESDGLQIFQNLYNCQIILKNLSAELTNLQTLTQNKLNHFDTRDDLTLLREKNYLSQVLNLLDCHDPFYREHTALFKKHNALKAEQAKLNALLTDYPIKLNQVNKKIKEVFILLTLNQTVNNAIHLNKAKEQLDISFEGYCPSQLNLAINRYNEALKQYNKQPDSNFFAMITNENLQTLVNKSLINKTDMQKYYDKHEQLRKQKFQTALNEIKEGWLKMQNQLKICQVQARNKTRSNQLPQLINFVELLKALSNLGEKLASFAHYRSAGEINFDPVNQYFKTRCTATTSRKSLINTLEQLCQSELPEDSLFELLRNNWENIREYGQELLQPPSSAANSPYHYFANTTDVHSTSVQSTSPPLITLH